MAMAMCAQMHTPRCVSSNFHVSQFSSSPPQSSSSICNVRSNWTRSSYRHSHTLLSSYSQPPRHLFSGAAHRHRQPLIDPPSNNKPNNQWQQLLLLASALSALILLPSWVRHGCLHAFPLLLFFIYMAFFLMSSLIRLRRFGELSPRSQDKQWATSPSRIAQIAFIFAVGGGHWAAAFQGPALNSPWTWSWPSLLAPGIFITALILHFYATSFLGKSFDRLVKPTALVVSGPYRFVRHPIYTSYMLLFAGYCVALRSYWSMAFLLTACILYYEQRVKLEEDMLLEAFREQYSAYREQVRSKYLPFVY